MTKSTRYYVRLVLAFINKFKLILLFGIGIGAASFVILNILIPRFESKTQKIGVIGEYTPSELPLSITSLISEGLTATDATGKPIPGIASSWGSPDGGRTWTFHLDTSLKWQDGSAITSKDINYNFSDATVDKPDKYTITFKLKTPLSDFAIVLSKPAFKYGLLGVGKWKVQGITLAGTFVESLTVKKANGEEKIFKFYPTEDRAKLAYKLGQVDELDNLSNPSPFDTWSLANVTSLVNKKQYVAVFFNTGDEIVGDKEIRQALSYAINKESWDKVRALGPISPDSWAYNPSVKPYDYDPSHAKDLIKESKLPQDKKKNLTIKLTTIPDLIPTAEKILADWKALGINATIQITSFAPDDYQAFLGISDIPTDPDQYSTWHSTQVEGNITRYKNTRIDKLLEDGRIEMSETKRKSIYFDFQKYLLEDAPATFLYYPTYYNVVRK